MTIEQMGFERDNRHLERSAADVWEIHGSDGLLDDGIMTKMSMGRSINTRSYLDVHAAFKCT